MTEPACVRQVGVSLVALIQRLTIQVRNTQHMASVVWRQISGAHPPHRLFAVCCLDSRTLGGNPRFPSRYLLMPQSSPTDEPH
jgi:hypothetical protein